MARSLDRVRLEAVTRRLGKKGGVVRTGTLIDATIIASIGTDKDGEARWVKHRGRAAVHGTKAHVAAAAGGIVRSVETTPAKVDDGRRLGAVLPESPGEVHADLAYASAANGQEIRAAGGRPHLPGRGVWAPAGDAAALARLEAWNAQAGRVRRRIEKSFGTWKRGYGLRRMRWRGPAKAALQVRLTAMAHNLRRALGILGATSP